MVTQKEHKIWCFFCEPVAIADVNISQMRFLILRKPLPLRQHQVAMGSGDQPGVALIIFLSKQSCHVAIC
jgi:hypothetical protein